jgi:hypothetical protein
MRGEPSHPKRKRNVKTKGKEKKEEKKNRRKVGG